MSTARDNLRDARQRKLNRAKRMGIDLSEERTKPGSNARSLAIAASRLMSDGIPSTNRERLQSDTPPSGAFNGINTTFVLSDAAEGLNIVVDFMDVSINTLIPLVRTDTSPPGAGEFFFDINAPSQIVVGTPPEAADALFVHFITTSR